MSLTIINSVPITGRLGEDTAITIQGTEFSSPAVVKFIGLDETDALSIVVVNSTKITCVVPGTLDSGDYDIQIDSGGQLQTLLNGVVMVPAMPVPNFGNETVDTIMSRMLQRLPDNADKREGSTYWDILSAIGVEVAELWVGVNQSLSLSLITETEGEYLDLAAVSVGATRLNAIKATGSITFIGASAIVVSAGTIVATTPTPSLLSIQYITDEDATLVDQGGGVFSIAIPSTAEFAGASSNVLANEINRVVTPVSGITSLTNPIINNGANAETDEEFRSRILRLARQPSHGGNIGDYIRWAGEASIEVGKVGIEPLASGPGTVSVYFLDRAGNVPDAALITIVQEYIDPQPSSEGGGKAPIGALVTVAAPTLNTIDVVVTVVVLPGLTAATIKTNVDVAITAFLTALDIGADVKFHELSAVMLAVVGVNTINTYTVEAGTVDVTILASEKAMPGTITVN